jgi:hypothetical protein
MECFKDVNVEEIASNIKTMPQNGSAETIAIPDIDDKEYCISAHELFDTISIVPLETTEQSIIGVVTKIKILNDTIFVLDNMKAKSLTMFTMKGKFIRKIGNIGNGPGEYVEPTDFFVDKNITVYDQYQQKIITYTKGGTLISDRKLPFLCFQFMKMSDNLYVFRDVDTRNVHIPQLSGYNLWTTDSAFHIIYKGLFREKGQWEPLFSPNSLSFSNGKLYVNDMFTDTIFRITENGLLPDYVLNFNGHRPEFVLKHKGEIKKARKTADYYCLHDCLVSDNYVFCNLTIKHKCCAIYYSKKTKKTVCVNNLSFDDEVSVYPPFFASFVYNDTFVGEKYANDLIGNKNFSRLKKYIGGDFSNIAPEDNPILFFYKMKKW